MSPDELKREISSHLREGESVANDGGETTENEEEEREENISVEVNDL